MHPRSPAFLTSRYLWIDDPMSRLGPTIFYPKSSHQDWMDRSWFSLGEREESEAWWPE